MVLSLGPMYEKIKFSRRRRIDFIDIISEVEVDKGQILRFDGLRAAIYFNDHRPAHIHVTSGGNSAVIDKGFLAHDVGWQRGSAPPVGGRAAKPRPRRAAGTANSAAGLRRNCRALPPPECRSGGRKGKLRARQTEPAGKCRRIEPAGTVNGAVERTRTSTGRPASTSS